MLLSPHVVGWTRTYLVERLMLFDASVGGRTSSGARHAQRRGGGERSTGERQA